MLECFSEEQVGAGPGEADARRQEPIFAPSIAESAEQVNTLAGLALKTLADLRALSEERTAISKEFTAALSAEDLPRLHPHGEVEPVTDAGYSDDERAQMMYTGGGMTSGC